MRYLLWYALLTLFCGLLSQPSSLLAFPATLVEQNWKISMEADGMITILEKQIDHAATLSPFTVQNDEYDNAAKAKFSIAIRMELKENRIVIQANQDIKDAKWSIYNSLGQQITVPGHQQENNQIRLDVSGLKPGMYVFNLIRDQQHFSQRISINR